MTFTEQEKQEIKRLYEAGQKTLAEISRQFNTSDFTIRKVAKEMGCAQRKPRKRRLKCCQKCGKKAAVHNARYCWNCGADMRSEGDILIEKISKISSRVMLVPENARDDFLSVLQGCKEYIKENEK